MTDNTALWTEKHRVKSHERDIHGKLSIQSIGNIFQEAAGNHANYRGFGVADLEENNETWVLARLKIQNENPAYWGENLTVETWVPNLASSLAERHFSLFNTDRGIAKAISYWAVIDITRRRPKRLQQYADKMPLIPEKKALSGPLKPVPAIQTPQDSGEYTVRYSDLDVLRHVNNVKYFDWFLDQYSLDFRDRYDISAFEINFLTEAQKDDPIQLFCALAQNNPVEYLHSAVRKTDNKPVVRAKITWQSK